MDRDLKLIKFASSIVEATQNNFSSSLIKEPETTSDNKFLYSETHYALLLILLYVQSGKDKNYLNLAELRLSLWDNLNVPVTFFNAQAVCLCQLILERENINHSGLLKISSKILERISPAREDAYKHDCGNNMYLQQVAVDLVLMPLAKKQTISTISLQALLSEFRKYQTPESFFYDLPRHPLKDERLCPPTYIMKEIFIAGICQTLVSSGELKEFLLPQLFAVLPFLTKEGNFSYFGRTDNSPFALGLTIFNLRLATKLFTEESSLLFNEACAKAEEYYLSFPRTDQQFLQCNRYFHPESDRELQYSRDSYAYVTQYSIASCAYALLAGYFFPEGTNKALSENPIIEKETVIRESKDLRIIKISNNKLELFLRTSSQLSSWDRRYFGPTILRLKSKEQLLIGAISRGLSTDYEVEKDTHGKSNFLLNVIKYFKRIFKQGNEVLDLTAVGYLPVLQLNSNDYFPYTLYDVKISKNKVELSYQVARILNRGISPCLEEIVKQLKKNIFLLNTTSNKLPASSICKDISFYREISLSNQECVIEDTFKGEIIGKKLIFSTRQFPQAKITIAGLDYLKTSTGWGSDGKQIVNYYQAECENESIQYKTTIELMKTGRVKLRL